jgi:hypothetical protein
MLCMATASTRGQENTLTRYEGSDYIFSGTLVKHFASTMPEYVKGKDASIVRVDKVLKASAGHENFEGREITVLLNDGQRGTLKEGSSGVFITKTWLFGNSLAVLAQAIDLENSRMENIQDEIKQYEQNQEYRMLESRVKSADLIVYGKVTRIEDLDPKGQFDETEHDPQYRVAVVIPEGVLKRSGDVDTVKFYFASSDDIRWYRAPKFNTGSEGIFLLQRAPELTKNQGTLTLLHPLDFQERAKMEEIKKMLK